MEFGLREYLLILGVILIVGLLVDGIRRTLKHKREGLKLDLMAAPPESPERSDVSKPRPVRKATPEELEPQVKADPLFDSTDASQLNLWAGEIKAESMKAVDTQTLTDSVETDTLTDSLFETEKPEMTTPNDEVIEDDQKSIAPRVEPVWDEQPTDDVTDDIEPDTTNSDDDHDEDMRILADEPVSRPIAESSETGLFGSALSRIFGFGKKATSPIEVAEPSETNNDLSDELDVAPAPESDSVDESMDDLVVVRIQSARAPRFEGIDLHKACLRAGLRRTESLMYQRIPMDESEAPLFSLVNGIEPGVFDEDAKSIDTPVVFLFVELPKQSDPVFAVNELISGARSIARDIGGDVFDQNGTAISKEWIDLARAQASHQNLLRS